MRRVAGVLTCLGITLASTVQAECTINFANARVDLGDIQRPASSRPSGLIHLPSRPLSLSVNCDRPTAMAVKFNAHGSAEAFAFGSAGHLQLRVSSAHLDGRAVELYAPPTPDQRAAAHRPNIALRPGEMRQPMIDGVLAKGRVLQLRMELTPALADSQFSVRDVRALEASITVEVLEHHAPG